MARAGKGTRDDANGGGPTEDSLTAQLMSVVRPLWASRQRAKIAILLVALAVVVGATA
jgi:hypothetical protein